MRQENLYQREPAYLLKSFKEVCYRIGQSMIHTNSWLHFEQIREYLESALLARMEQQSPPFNPGDKVRSTETVICQDCSQALAPGVWSVDRVLYRLGGEWSLVLAGTDLRPSMWKGIPYKDCRFSASCFNAVSEESHSPSPPSHAVGVV